MSESDHITGRQISAARALLGVQQSELAKAANISVPTLRRMEASEGPAQGMANNVRAVRHVLESEGIEFIIDGNGGVGVRQVRRQPD